MPHGPFTATRSHIHTIRTHTGVSAHRKQALAQHHAPTHTRFTHASTDGTTHTHPGPTSPTRATLTTRSLTLPAANRAQAAQHNVVAASHLARQVQRGGHPRHVLAADAVRARRQPERCCSSGGCTRPESKPESARGGRHCRHGITANHMRRLPSQRQASRSPLQAQRATTTCRRQGGPKSDATHARTRAAVSPAHALGSDQGKHSGLTTTQ
jgi:hypothetical protein